ncbi:unnamed protein product (macronuclear) [Paramecium tetraurelia]|uniref:UBC core domain-containing protein n=1 Tax=Paramecium tetraurelia TaxID=5888 RepID=A0DZ21_PARTE|nr:uncharacterized protein GSPATT00003257001 [Paramecium tetraurelia]CAK88288.1 unnamed protein product [Paramecium tetraurelia]|eukprot:XP_001455685.1 hypothetical protein (macronuclear) [Paramecium tetraurelia strain d4-2]
MLLFPLNIYRNLNEQCSLRRLQIDMLDHKLNQLNDDTCEITIKMDKDNILQIQMRPKIGPYKLKNYLFLLDFRKNYPISPPIITIGSETLHPNIDRKNQKFYLRLIEQQNWKPIYGLFEIVEEMKKTLIHVDFTIIPNETICLKMAQQILNQNQLDNECENQINSEYDSDQETFDFEISRAFKMNFEIVDSSQYNIQLQSDSQHIYQNLPAIINLQNTSKHKQNDNMFFIKIKS